MKVNELMTEKVITISPEDKVDKVFFLFHYESIRHLPVVTEKGTLVGIISDRDIKKVLGPRHKKHMQNDGTLLTVSARKVRMMMHRQPMTIGPDERAAEAAAIMVSNKIGALPVINNKKLVGIITATDILKSYVKLSNLVDSFNQSVKG
jgi:acetoin utilization protein AcuB